MKQINFNISEIKDESGRNTIIVKESIDEIYKQINKE